MNCFRTIGWLLSLGGALGCGRSETSPEDGTNSEDSTEVNCNNPSRNKGANPDYAKADRYILANRNGLRCHGRPLLPNPDAGISGVSCNNDSLNFERATGDQEAVRYVVIHTIEGWEEATEECFSSPNWRSATHYVVGRSCPAAGEPDAGTLWSNANARVSLQYPVVVTQMVSEADTAKHTASLVLDRLSVGIEHEGFTKSNSYLLTEEQYLRSARLVRDIILRHNIPLDREHVIGHYQIPRCDIACSSPWTPSCACEQNLQVCSAAKSNDDCTATTRNHSDPGSIWPWDRYFDMIRLDATVVEATCTPQSDGTALVALEVDNTGISGWGKEDVAVGTTLPWDWLDATRPWNQAAAQAETLRWRAESDATTPRDHDSPVAASGWLSPRRVKYTGELAPGAHATITWSLAAQAGATGKALETFGFVGRDAASGRETWFALDQAVSLLITRGAGATGTVITQCEVVKTPQPIEVPTQDAGITTPPAEACQGKIGWYCGATNQFPYGDPSTRYLCVSGALSNSQKCPAGCQTNSPGTDDTCK